MSDSLTPAHQAKVLEIAESLGCTWLDVLLEKAQEFDTMLKTPAARIIGEEGFGPVKDRAAYCHPNPLSCVQTRVLIPRVTLEE
jgi:hypothetical protein